MIRKTNPLKSATALGGSSTSLIMDAAFIEIRPGVTTRYGLCPVAQLLANPHNARVHSSKQIKKIARSLEIAGHLSPVVADEAWTILAGHGRVEASKRSGAASVPVVQVVGLAEAQKRVFLIADNRIAEDARTDRKKLAEQIPELTPLLESIDCHLTDTGLEAAEIDQLTIDFEESSHNPADEIDPALLQENTILQQGDIFALGEHRLLVGDARDRSAVERLMNGEQAAAGFLDLPYNVKISSIVGRGKIQHAEFAMGSGEMSRAEFVSFMKTTLSNVAHVSRQSAVHFLCIDWKHVHQMIEAAEAVYTSYLNLVVWNKTNAGQGGTYRSQHELIGVFRIGEEPHQDNVQKGKFGRTRSNVWTYPGVNTFRAGRMNDLAAHPTVKPTALVADAFKDVTRRNEWVIDTFVGSGTSILAAETIGRRAAALEIEPKYAQIAIRRWENFTGRDAIHLETGLTLNDLIKQRSIQAPQVRVRTRVQK